MHVAIIGAAGMLGRKLTARLAVDGRLGSADLDHLTLLDVVEPDPPAGWTGTLDRARVDLGDPAGAVSAVAGRPARRRPFRCRSPGSVADTLWSPSGRA